MLTTFAVPGELFDRIGSGAVTPDGLALLGDAQLSKRLLLVRAIVARAGGDDPAVARLLRAERDAPAAVREELRSPWVGSWAGGLARRMAAGGTVGAEVSYLGTLARRSAGEPADTGHPLRAGDFTVTLEDADPYRDCFGMALTGRLPEPAVRRWQATFATAYALLAEHVPDRAAELRAGLRAVVPLAGIAGAPGLSATSHDAYGGFALTEPADPAAFATTMVHEFQHSKLSGLIDLVPLYDPAAPDRYFAPWRRDPRPLGGLLQGVYAFLAVAETWHALRAAPGLADRAEIQFAELVTQLGETLPPLRTAPGLTPAGRRFTDGLAGWLDRLAGHPVRPGVADRVRRDFRDLKAGWQARHGVTATAARSPR